MADPKIIIRRSSTPNKVPTESQLSLGELAINTYDGKLYLEKDQSSTGLGVTVIAVNPWSVGVGSLAYDINFTAGNVGIGSTNPKTPLQVEIYGVDTGFIVHDSRVGIASDIDNFDISSANFLTLEYTVHVGYGTYIQSQKVLVMHDGEYAYSQEYGVMYQPGLIASIGVTMTGSTVKLQATPETGISGITTYRFVRQTVL